MGRYTALARKQRHKEPQREEGSVAVVSKHSVKINYIYNDIYNNNTTPPVVKSKGSYTNLRNTKLTKLSEASAPPTSPTAQVALEAMRHGCGLRRVAEGVLTGDKDLRVLAKSVLVYWLEGEEGSADWEEWLIPVCEALDIVVSEEDVT